MRAPLVDLAARRAAGLAATLRALAFGLPLATAFLAFLAGVLVLAGALRTGACALGPVGLLLAADGFALDVLELGLTFVGLVSL